MNITACGEEVTPSPQEPGVLQGRRSAWWQTVGLIGTAHYWLLTDDQFLLRFSIIIATNTINEEWCAYYPVP